MTTGGPVAGFFDAVIPVEETEYADETHIKVLKQMTSGQFIREPGSDIRQGDVVLEKSQVLHAAEIGLLATVGRVKAIHVYRKPKIGLVSTGNELVEASTEQLEDGKIRDSNKLMLTSILRDLASEIKDYGAVGDSEAELDEVMQKASKECDIVVTSGGVSMGELDLVKPYLEARGEVHFGRINMKPGKPTTFASLNSALAFALPGNPVSAFVTAHLFIVPAAKLLAGHLDSHTYPSLTVQLIPRSVKVDPERPEYHRVVIVQDSSSGKLFAFSTGS